MSELTDFFDKQTFKYASPRALHTEWFAVSKPEMIPELEKITGLEFTFDKKKCRISKQFNRDLYDKTIKRTTRI